MKCKNFILFLLCFSFLLLLTRHVGAAVAFVIIGSFGVCSSCLCASSFYFSRLFMFLFTDAYDTSLCVCVCLYNCVCVYLLGGTKLSSTQLFKHDMQWWVNHKGEHIS